MNVEELIAKLGLSPLQMEGGYFAETYRSADGFSTAIYYVLTPDTFSAMHRLASDEVFHFYSGDPVEMLRLFPDGSHEIVMIGSGILAGQRPQLVVPKGVWQGCRLVPGGEYALMGTTVAPAFRCEDYEHGDPDSLITEYPDCAELITALSTPRRT